MKKIIALLSAFSTSAQAHESLVSHAHPHSFPAFAGPEAVVGVLLPAHLDSWTINSQ